MAPQNYNYTALPASLLHDFLTTVDINTISADYPSNYAISETGEHIIQYALAGFNKQDIHIEVDGSELLLFVEKKKQTNSPKFKYIKHQIASRSMKISWEVPSNLDIKKISCNFEEGILTITIPESKSTKDARFKIEL